MFKNLGLTPINFIPYVGQPSTHSDGFYVDPEGKVWESFESIWLE